MFNTYDYVSSYLNRSQEWPTLKRMFEFLDLSGLFIAHMIFVQPSYVRILLVAKVIELENT